MTARVGLGYDIHPVGGDAPLVLGGVRLDGPGLIGFSDADAVAHALADALLSAAGRGDLGEWFPAGDERYRDVSSVGLLAEVAAGLAEDGWRLENVAVVVSAEAPKLAPHLDAMAEHLGTALGLLAPPPAPGEPPRVSVTAKHGEGVGAVGRGEAIEARAIALLRREPTG